MLLSMTPKNEERSENQDKSQPGKTEPYYLAQYLHSPLIYHVIGQLK